MKRILSLALVLIIGVGVCLALFGCDIRIRPTSWSGKYTYDNAKKYTAGATNYASGTVKNFDIDWGAGEIRIYSSEEVQEIVISEVVFTGLKDETPQEVDSSEVLYRWLDGDTLRIRFLKSKWRKQEVHAKTLAITVPAECSLGNIQIKSDSADVILGGLTATGVDLQSTSGELHVGDFTADTVKLSSSSGKAYCLNGTARTLNVETSSGEICVGEVEELALLEVKSTSGYIEYMKGSTLPEEARVESTSGDVKLILRTGSTLTVVYETSGGTYALSGFEETVDGYTHKIDGGGPLWQIKTDSGDLSITRILDN